MQPGETIHGYRLVSHLGDGGMATVWRAVGLDGRPVAIKVLDEKLARRPQVRQRFFAEGDLQSKLRHPNIVRVEQILLDPLALVMEWVEGGALSRLLRKTRLEPGHVRELMAGITAGVGAAHAAGIVHRDLKPHNVLLDRDGVPKVADFGLAKIIGWDGQTRTGQVMGTLKYMAPEQFRGAKHIDARADVYALGVMLYQMLAGRPPFTGSEFDMGHAHLNEPPPDPRRFVPEIPDVLVALLGETLAKDPAARPADANELGRRLDEAFDAWEVGATSVALPMVRLDENGVPEADEEPSEDGFPEPDAEEPIAEAPAADEPSRVSSAPPAPSLSEAGRRGLPTWLWVVAVIIPGLVLATGVVIRLLRTPTEAPAETVAGGEAPEPIEVGGAPVSVAPQSVAPVDTAPQSVAPQSVAPQSVAPQSVAPQSVAPVSAAPLSVAPQSVAAMRGAPQSVAPAGAESLGVVRLVPPGGPPSVPPMAAEGAAVAVIDLGEHPPGNAAADEIAIAVVSAPPELFEPPGGSTQVPTVGNPGNFGEVLTRGLVLVTQQRYAEAVPVLEEAAALDPEAPLPQKALCAVLSELQRPEPALRHCHRWRALETVPHEQEMAEDAIDDLDELRP